VGFPRHRGDGKVLTVPKLCLFKTRGGAGHSFVPLKKKSGSADQ
jgi:hypothetical protein